MKKRITSIFLALTLMFGGFLSAGAHANASSYYFTISSPIEKGTYDLNDGVNITVTSRIYFYRYIYGFLIKAPEYVLVEILKDGKRQYYKTFPYIASDLAAGTSYPVMGTPMTDTFKPKVPGTYTIHTGWSGSNSDHIENVIDSYNFKVTFKPKATKISSIKPGRKSFLVKWKKQTNLTTGYQIRYSVKSSMASAKKVTIRKKETTSRTVARLKSKKKYYVQVRTYHKLAGKTYFSFWSAKKAVKVK